MKKLILSIGVAALAVACHAQLPISLNGAWIGGAGYERGLNTGNNIAYGYIGYNFVTNSSGFAGGVIGGVENLWKGSVSSAQSLSGGFQVSYSLKPFQQLGLGFGTNVTATVAGYTLLATPRDSTAPIGNVTGTTVALDIYEFKGFTLKVQGNYGIRTGQGHWDDKYIGGGLALSKNF